MHNYYLIVNLNLRKRVNNSNLKK